MSSKNRGASQTPAVGKRVINVLSCFRNPIPLRNVGGGGDVIWWEKI
jgi:hypothetical protein